MIRWKNEKKKAHLKVTSGSLQGSKGEGERDKRQQYATPSENPLPKTKADMNDGAPKEKVSETMD